jgi:cellulose synthase/poly-beta-1,6-N-acetylglucosamine synthase-like glycosyltransferase
MLPILTRVFQLRNSYNNDIVISPHLETNLMTKVTILVCVYNGADTIGRCIESLLQQDYPAELIEIIIAENGSSDNTIEVVRKYPVILLQCAVRGKTLALNYGIEQATGDIIAMTDADCIADPSWVSNLVKYYADPEVGGVGGLISDYVHDNMNIIERFTAESKPIVNFISGDNEFLPHITGANASYRRSVLFDCGLYDPRLPTSDDIEISWRMQLKTGKKVAYAPDAIIYHHHRSTRRGLARQYLQYGFGEILLDTTFRHEPGYPRTRKFQLKRMWSQILVLPRYLVSAVIRRIRLLLGRATPYDAAFPLLRFMIESNNIRGKLDAFVRTRFMTDTEGVLKHDPNVFIDSFYQQRKE